MAQNAYEKDQKILVVINPQNNVDGVTSKTLRAWVREQGYENECFTTGPVVGDDWSAFSQTVRDQISDASCVWRAIVVKEGDLPDAVLANLRATASNTHFLEMPNESSGV